MIRKMTNKIIELVEDSIINETDLYKNLLNYLSEAEVEDFINNYYPDFIEDNDDN